MTFSVGKALIEVAMGSRSLSPLGRSGFLRYEPGRGEAIARLLRVQKRAAIIMGSIAWVAQWLVVQVVVAFG